MSAPVATPPAPPLSHNEAMALQTWMDLRRDNGIEPSLREVVTRLGKPLNHQALAWKWLKTAVDLGILSHHEGVSRGLRLRLPESEARHILTRCLPAEYLTPWPGEEERADVA